MPDANPKAFDLHDFVPHLVARVGALMAQSFAPQLEAAGVTMQMWRVAVVLHFNGPLTLVDISRLIGVKTSTLSRLVGRMIDRNLVSRRRSEEDARTVRISLCKEGKALIGKLWPEAVKAQERVVAPFSGAEIEQLKEMLLKIETILVDQLEAQHRARRA